MEQTTIDYLRAERQRHLENIRAINHKAEIFEQQYQKAIDIEIQGVEYCENTLSEAGIPIEEDTPETQQDQNNNKGE